MIRPATSFDAQAIADIYNYYIVNTVVTFEVEPVSIEEMAKRILSVLERYDWIVYENKQGEVVGFAYYSAFRPRAAYCHTVESTIYLHRHAVGKGVGSALLTELVQRCRKQQFHAMIATIALPNEQSVHLHEKHGYKKVGEFREVGFKQERWINVGYWELLLE